MTAALWQSFQSNLQLLSSAFAECGLWPFSRQQILRHCQQPADLAVQLQPAAAEAAGASSNRTPAALSALLGIMTAQRQKRYRSAVRDAQRLWQEALNGIEEDFAVPAAMAHARDGKEAPAGGSGGSKKRQLLKK